MSVLNTNHRHFVTLGMFILDELAYEDESVVNHSGIHTQLGGGTYSAIGARIWLPDNEVGMIVDRGNDWPEDAQQELDAYGHDLWLFRDDQTRATTRARNTLRGDSRGFQYLTPRVRITPRDLEGTKLSRPDSLHFIYSPERAMAIISEINSIEEWNPTIIYEPVPYSCVPEELAGLVDVLPLISIFSPNADEALAILSLPLPITKEQVANAASQFLETGVGLTGDGAILIRSGALGVYVATRKHGGRWVDAFWGAEDAHKVVEVTGAGNGFLGGLSAGLKLAGGNMDEAILYATVSASFIIEQQGLPKLHHSVNPNGEIIETWNQDSPTERLQKLQKKYRKGQ